MDERKMKPYPDLAIEVQNAFSLVVIVGESLAVLLPFDSEPPS